MQKLVIWINKVIAYSILQTTVINLTADKKYADMIKFISGLIAVLIIIEPITYLKNINSNDVLNSLSEIFAQNTDSSFSDEALKTENEFLTQLYEQSVYDNLENILKEYGIYNAMLNIKRVNESSDDIHVESIEIIFEQDESPSIYIQNEIKKYISDFYMLSQNNINISIRGNAE